jgi:serine/threonine protein kinase/dipeptidyl aminopeptidase/acylaminoacyl peptidase
MPLSSGDRLGPYEIGAPLGAGGMGEVYRARDSKLNRDVAIKVLPAAFANDAQYMARFEREAQVLASLNHPNIATVYGIEQGALVMELVAGADLRGPMPLDEAIPIARQIAVGLEAAHERGIVHRDLKPANIKITPAGVVKLLDFGLAKSAGDFAASPVGMSPGTSPTMSPTLSLAMTQAGMILGTAAYMSPEQARGKPVDKRADIWAFGVVVYELLTGKMLFGGGETVTDTLASVVKDTPDLNQLPAATPRYVRVLLERCLRKDMNTRLRDIGEARIALENPPVEVVAEVAAAPLPSRRSVLPWVAAGICALSTLALGVLWLRRPVEEPRTVKFAIPAPEKMAFAQGLPAISPDGRRIAFAATSEGKDQIWVRDLDTATARPLAGTEGTVTTQTPFWSPDSRYLAFFADGKLKRIDPSGGPPLTLCDAPGPRSGSWGNRDVIVFGANLAAPLMRVPAAGGTPTPVTELDVTRGEITHRWPWFLPDGRHFLYLARGSDREKSAVWIGDLDSKARRLAVSAVSNAIYDPRGYLLFVRENTLMAQPWDGGRLQATGDAFPAAEQVGFMSNNSLGEFSISQTGALVFFTGSGAIGAHLTWFDRAGKALGRVGPPAAMIQPAISPDGRMVAIDRQDPQTGRLDIWLHDLTHDTDSRFTFGPGTNYYPAWSPDGNHIAFIARRAGGSGVYVKPASGSGKEELLFESGESKSGTNWSHDGKFLTFGQLGLKTGNDIWVLPNPLGDAGSRKPFDFLGTDAQEFYGALSPDGKYMAYTSDESHVRQVYVQSFPGKEGKFQISNAGGGRPVWSRDGKELFYIAADRKLMAVEVKTGARFEHGIPRALFEARISGTSYYDVSPDGKRFLMILAQDDAAAASLTVVLNWLAGVKK